MTAPRFSAISVSLGPDAVGHLALARPSKGNAINREMWSELGPGLEHLVAAGARAVRRRAGVGRRGGSEGHWMCCGMEFFLHSSLLTSY